MISATDPPGFKAVVLKQAPGNPGERPVKRARCSRVEIPVKAQPRPYRPRSGPPLQPISLLPKNDSNAFIVGKIALPIAPVRDTVAQRRLYYIVSWRDLPHVRVTIPCTNILDYVSPCAVEQWEYEDLLKREGDALEEPEKPPRGQKKKKSRKRRGRRPPKAALVDAPPPQAQLGKEDEALLARKMAAGPSLSTPTKPQIEKLLAEGEDTSEAEYEDFEDLPADQLPVQGTSLEESEYQGTTDETGSDMLIDDQSLESGNALPAISASPSRHMSPARKTVTLGTLHTSSATKRSAESSPSRLAKFAKTGKDLSVTEDDATPRSFKPLQQTLFKTPWPSVTQLLESSKSAKIADATSSSIESAVGVRRETPIYPPKFGASTLFRANGSQPTSSIKHVTPVGTPSTSSQLADLTPTQTPVTSKKGKRKATAEEEPAEELPAEQPAWEVKRLEGMKEIDGVRYFKVRWKGGWPPDENPTWEPEENISKGLVRSYLKKLAAKGKDVTPGSTQKSAQKDIRRFFTTKFNSVQEAFEGGEDLLHVPTPATSIDDTHQRRPHEIEGDDENKDEEEFRVTEDGSPRLKKASQSLGAPKRAPSNNANLAHQFAIFNQAFHRRSSS